MRAVLTRQPTDTTLPGETRRQVWPAPEVTSHALLVLTATRLFLVPAKDAISPETIAALDKGGDPTTLLPSAECIELTAVERVGLRLETNTLLLEHRDSPRERRTTEVTFAHPELVDLIFEKIWRRLGPEIALIPFQEDRWTLLRMPLLVMGSVLTFTIALASIMNAADDGIAPTRTHGLPEWLDWRFVCGVGGVVLAMVQVWTYRRVTRPPTRLELHRALTANGSSD